MITLVKFDGLATIHSVGEKDGGLYDYDRALRDDEIVDDVAVKDWPDGMHEVQTLPPEPKPQEG
jgi:hypothetical protein